MNSTDDTNATAAAGPVGRPVRPCATERDSWGYPNMREVEGDTSMTHEHYACTVCGRRMALDYEEMR